MCYTRPLPPPKDAASVGAATLPITDATLISLSDDASMFAVGTASGHVHLYSTSQTLDTQSSSAAELRRDSFGSVENKVKITQVVWRPSSSSSSPLHYAVLLSSGEVYLVNLLEATPKLIQETPVSCIAWSPDGAVLAMGGGSDSGSDGNSGGEGADTIALWSCADARVMTSLQVESQDASADCQALAVEGVYWLSCSAMLVVARLVEDGGVTDMAPCCVVSWDSAAPPSAPSQLSLTEFFPINVLLLAQEREHQFNQEGAGVCLAAATVPQWGTTVFAHSHANDDHIKLTQCSNITQCIGVDVTDDKLAIRIPNAAFTSDDADDADEDNFVVGLGFDCTARQVVVQHPTDDNAPDLLPQPVLWIATSDGVLRAYTFGSLDASKNGAVVVGEPRPVPVPPLELIMKSSSASTGVGGGGEGGGVEEQAAATALPDEDSDFGSEVESEVKLESESEEEEEIKPSFGFSAAAASKPLFPPPSSASAPLNTTTSTTPTASGGGAFGFGAASPQTAAFNFAAPSQPPKELTPTKSSMPPLPSPTQMKAAQALLAKAAPRQPSPPSPPSTKPPLQPSKQPEKEQVEVEQPASSIKSATVVPEPVARLQSIGEEAATIEKTFLESLLETRLLEASTHDAITDVLHVVAGGDTTNENENDDSYFSDFGVLRERVHSLQGQLMEAADALKVLRNEFDGTAAGVKESYTRIEGMPAFQPSVDKTKQSSSSSPEDILRRRQPIDPGLGSLRDSARSNIRALSQKLEEVKDCVTALEDRQRQLKSSSTSGGGENNRLRTNSSSSIEYQQHPALKLYEALNAQSAIIKAQTARLDEVAAAVRSAGLLRITSSFDVDVDEALVMGGGYGRSGTSSSSSLSIGGGGGGGGGGSAYSISTDNNRVPWQSVRTSPLRTQSPSPSPPPMRSRSTPSHTLRLSSPSPASSSSSSTIKDVVLQRCRGIDGGVRVVEVDTPFITSASSPWRGGGGGVSKKKNITSNRAASPLPALKPLVLPELPKPYIHVATVAAPPKPKQKSTRTASAAAAVPLKSRIAPKSTFSSPPPPTTSQQQPPLPSFAQMQAASSLGAKVLQQKQVVKKETPSQPPLPSLSQMSAAKDLMAKAKGAVTTPSPSPSPPVPTAAAAAAAQARFEAFSSTQSESKKKKEEPPSPVVIEEVEEKKPPEAAPSLAFSSFGFGGGGGGGTSPAAASSPFGMPSFGASTGAASSPFGAAPSTTKSVFGAQSTTPPKTASSASSSPFGATPSPSPSPSTGFGLSTPAPASASAGASPFGQQQQPSSTPSIFGGSSTATTTTPSIFSGGAAFGAPASPGGIFGGNSAASAATTTGGGGTAAFGAPASPGGIFGGGGGGASTIAPVFGAPSAFGSKPSPGGTFGQASTFGSGVASASSAFGQPAFGQPAAAPSAFGQPAQMGGGGGGVFGDFAAQPSAFSSFAQQQQQPQQQGGFTGFGAAPTAPTPAKSPSSSLWQPRK